MARVLLRLSSLRFLLRYFIITYRIFIAIIPEHVWRDIGVVLSHCKHDQFTTSLLKFQHTSLHAAAYRERRSACDCATLGEQLLHEIPPQLPLKSCRRWSGAVLMTSQLPACVSVVAFNLVYFVQFKWKIGKKTCSATNVAGTHNATELRIW